MYIGQRSGVDSVDNYKGMGRVSNIHLREKRSPFTSHEDIRDRSQPEFVCSQCHLKGTHH